MSKPPSPIFTFFGVTDGATCCHLENDKIFVGGQTGKVFVFGMASKVMEGIVYEDEEGRRIQSIDFSGKSGSLFVHVRGHAILELRSPDWTLVRNIDVDHVGFCNSISIDGRLLFVSSDEQRFPLLCWNSEDVLKTKKIGSVIDITPMCLTKGEDQEIIIGMEDGQLAVFREADDSFQMLKLGRDPVFCAASCSKFISAGCARSPIYLVSRNDWKVKEVNYPPDAAGCSSITFSPTSKQILAGFWDGSIRVFSCLRLTVLLCLSSHHSSTISSLIWNPPEKGEEVVIAASSDSTVTLWKLR